MSSHPWKVKKCRGARLALIIAIGAVLCSALLFFLYNVSQGGFMFKALSTHSLVDADAAPFPMTKLAVVMALDDKEGMYGESSVVNKEDYCRYWGCKLIVDGIQDTTRTPVWSKLLTLREAMDKHRDIEWFWWLDADSVIMDPYLAVTKSIIDSIPAGEDRHFIIAKDCLGFNAGSFMVRNSLWSRLFLSLLYLPDFSEKFFFAEQGTIQYFFESTPYIKQYLHLVPLRSFNSFTFDACGDRDRFAYRPGDLLIHLAGCRKHHNCKPLFDDHMRRRIQLSDQEKVFSAKQVRFDSDLYRQQRAHIDPSPDSAAV